GVVLVGMFTGELGRPSGAATAENQPQRSRFWLRVGVEGVIAAVEAARSRSERRLQVAERFLQASEPLAPVGKRKTESLVLLVIPTGPPAEIEAATRHLIDGGRVLGDD